MSGFISSSSQARWCSRFVWRSPWSRRPELSWPGVVSASVELLCVESECTRALGSSEVAPRWMWSRVASARRRAARWRGSPGSDPCRFDCPSKQHASNKLYKGNFSIQFPKNRDNLRLTFNNEIADRPELNCVWTRYRLFKQNVRVTSSKVSIKAKRKQFADNFVRFECISIKMHVYPQFDAFVWYLSASTWVYPICCIWVTWPKRVQSF